MGSVTRILVVDDEAAIRDSLRDCLKNHGYEVVAVEDGFKALEQIAGNVWDVCLVDLKMPGMDGLTLLKRIHDINMNIPVIIITGYGSVDNAVVAMKQGAVDYVMKPFTAEEIIIRVNTVLEHVRLRADNTRLLQEVTEKYKFGNIIGKSKIMQDLFRLVEKVAPTDSTILIRGQSGTGKELIARAIHYNSLRKDKKFIAVDCGALPETLLESELFGHVKGSFTGAIVTKRGLLEVANGGTFFLDEVGDLSIGIQAKLLRVLQEKEFRQVGGIKNITVDIRLIAATNRDLEGMIKENLFREDLFYRLNIVPIYLPLLKKRREDIPLLVSHFIEKYNRKRNKTVKGLTPEALNALIDFDWPGNIRELENIVERLVIMCDDEMVDIGQIPMHIKGKEMYMKIVTPRSNEELKKVKRKIRQEAVHNIEKAFVIDALKRNNWNITKTAQDVGLKRQNLQTLIRKYKIIKP